MKCTLIADQLRSYKHKTKDTTIRWRENNKPMPLSQLVPRITSVIKRYNPILSAPPTASAVDNSTVSTVSSSSSSSSTSTGNNTCNLVDPTPAANAASFGRTAQPSNKTKPKSNPATATGTTPTPQPPPKPRGRPATKQKPPKARKLTLVCCGALERRGDESVQCDSCNNWYHCKCEHISYEAAQAIATYMCRSCIDDCASD